MTRGTCSSTPAGSSNHVRGPEVTSFISPEVDDLYETLLVRETFIVRRADEQGHGNDELEPLRRLVEEQERQQRTGPYLHSPTRVA